MRIAPRPIDRAPHPSRRQVLIAGSLGFAGFGLADLLRAEAVSGSGKVNSIINIHLDGGPPQHETIDPKPDAPDGIRGEFRPIATRVSGIRISELMPKTASILDRFALIRSLVGSAGAHDAFQCQSGYDDKDLRSVGGRPAVGCVVGKLLGRAEDPVPAFIDLLQGRALVRNSARPGFLGPSYSPMRLDLSAMFPRELEKEMKTELAARTKQSIQLTLTQGITGARIADRRTLLHQFDAVRRGVDTLGSMDAMDRFEQQAVSILTSDRLAIALDPERETASTLARYTPPPISGKLFETAEDERSARKLLIARRLVEAGVRCVSVSFSDFDTHSNNTPRMRQLVPIVDHAVHALVTDLEERGMLDRVAVVLWGEFGRTPKINREGGRDHWPEVSPAWMCGGGISGGRAIGATDKTGSRVVERPVSWQDMFATLYRTLGIDAAQTVLKDPTGRPQFALDTGKPIHELF